METRKPVMVWLWVLLVVVLGVPAVASLVGAFLPRDHVARMTIRSQSAPDRVWASISDFGGTARWRTDVVAVDVLDAAGGPIRFVETSRQGKVTYEVQSQQPPRRQVIRVVDEGQPFGGTWTFDLEPDGDGSRLTITEAGFIRNPLFRVMAKLFFKPSATIEAYLRALATHLGDRATPREVRMP